MWLYKFPNIIEDIIFFGCIFLASLFKLIDLLWVDLFLGSLLCSIDLCVCFYANTILIWLLQICNIIWNQEGDASSLVLFSQDCFGYFGVFHSSIQILGFFPISTETDIGILIGIT